MRSRPPKKALLGSPSFFLVASEDLEGLDEWAEYLDSILHGPCRIEELAGSLLLVEERKLVDHVRGLKVKIFGDEHPPPHFHVESSDVDASFTINDCRLINGTVSGKELRAIQYWHKLARPHLVNVWNTTRPDGCSVGVFREHN